MGEEKSSRIFNKEESSLDLYLGDDRSTNRIPWCFCVPHRWCSNYELVTPAYLERESVTWCYGEKYIERENKRVIEIFKVNRKYRELVERLGVEMVNNYNEYLPCSKIEIVITVDGDNNDNNYLPWVVKGVVVENYDDYMTNMIMTDNTEVDRTIPDRDMVYDKKLQNKPFNSGNKIVEEYKILNKYYINNNNIIYMIKNILYRPKIRMLFNDGG